MSKMKINTVENVSGSKSFTVDEVRAMLDEVSSGNVGIGVGQTWQSVKAHRAINVLYTNSTSKPIQVMVTPSENRNGNWGQWWVEVGGVRIGSVSDYRQDPISGGTAITFIVPHGETYKIVPFEAMYDTTIDLWTELR